VTPEEQAVADRAAQFARDNRRAIARELTDKTVYLPEESPVSVFMAGSPGAGKTEASQALVKQFGHVLRIDPDEIRMRFEEYNGKNAWIFQRATTMIVEKVLDQAFKQDQSFILDGTLSNLEVARRNVGRSLRAGRYVQLVYVYQDPVQAWHFVRDRERVEGRCVPKDQFIDQYFASRKVVNQLKQERGKALALDVLIKNLDGTNRKYHRNVDSVDPHIREAYDPASLAQAIESL
jgi:predicted ABC-type ATPase